MGTNIGLYIRVSTDRQARIDEGSLKSQKQRLEDWVHLSNKAYGKDYKIFKTYQDVESGQTAQRPDYQKMLNDIRSERLGAIVAISISRLNRSLKDFYELHELCEKHEVAILSLKENFDTSTAIGRALLKFMLVFYELESEQTGERVSDNKLARANRGLWTGSRIFGYNPVPGKKGYLEPDPLNSHTVQFIFDTYLETGSIGIVRTRLKEKGLKTAEYTTEKGMIRKQQDFADETLRRILTNMAYIGKSELGKNPKSKYRSKLPDDQKRKIIDGNWQPIIDNDKFAQVQEILKRNSTFKGNIVSTKKKNFLLAGLIFCGECSSSDGQSQIPMKTASGTSKSGKSHYYYLCGNCKRRVQAGFIENMVQSKLGELSKDAPKLRKLIEEANRIVTEELPKLKNQLAELQSVKNQKMAELDQLYRDARQLDTSKVKEILQSRGEGIAEEIQEYDKRIQLKENEISKQNAYRVDSQLVKETLSNFAAVYGNLMPYEQQQVMRYLIDNVQNFEKEVRISFDGGAYIEPIKKGSGKVFFQTPIQRGRRDSNSRPPA